MSDRVALCLNSSFLGFFAHAGFLEALTETGVRPVALSGASAGALVAGAHASGLHPREVTQWLLAGNLGGAFWEWGGAWRAWRTLMNRRGHTGMLRGHHALAMLRERLGECRIEDCRPRLALSATELTHPRAALLTTGPLAEGILASGAFPGMFAAQRIGGGHYWDGGLVNPLPFDHWLDDPGIDTIIVHVVTNPVEAPQPARMRVMLAFGAAHEAICDELLRLKTALAHHAGKRLILLHTTAPRPLPWNTARTGPRCVEAGAATVAQNRELLLSLVSAAQREAAMPPA